MLKTFLKVILVTVVALGGVVFGGVGGCWLGAVPVILRERAGMPEAGADWLLVVGGVVVGMGLGLLAAVRLAEYLFRRREE